jgi:hypothetical protein
MFFSANATIIFKRGSRFCIFTALEVCLFQSQRSALQMADYFMNKMTGVLFEVFLKWSEYQVGHTKTVKPT